MDGIGWILFNASPDLRSQLEAAPPLQPRTGLRDTGIRGIVLADSQIDHTTGILMLREGCPLQIYCTDMVAEDLSTGFPIFRMLESWDGGVEHHEVPTDGSSFSVDGVEGLQLTAVALDGKAPPYSPHRNDPHRGDNVGYLVTDTNAGTSLLYAPGLGQMTPELVALMKTTDLVMVDGTFWCEDEMARAGVGTKLASQMGHLPQSGHDGMLAWLKTVERPRKMLIHINNTNPILIEDSPERAEVEAQGIEVAIDGLEFEVQMMGSQLETGDISRDVAP